MALSPGTRIGPYEILLPLGVGGMGEVYKARDVKLDRHVAIKVLPQALVSEPERVARFQREAKTLASLNHPNIAAIYGLEEAGGVTALVMELVDGEDLSERIRRGAIPLDEATLIAEQIAVALEAAHEQGIIHRDLKPANIKMRPDGAVKVLDFGLAKLVLPDTAAAHANVAAAQTITAPAVTTGAGVILGTAAYMAPEQAKGRPADRRSDIWSFGCVLFEMLTGTRAFEGNDVASTLAAVIDADPNWEALPIDLPAALRLLLTKCLVKDRTQRLASMSTVHFLLTNEAPDGPAADTFAARGTLQRRPSWRRMAPYVAAIVTVALGTYFVLMSRVAPLVPLVSRFVVPLGVSDQFTNAGRHLVTVSPDGRRIAYAASNRLYLRSLDQLESTPIRGTDGAGVASPRSPFFSPDGQWVGFWSDSQLKKIAALGGAAVTLSAADNPFGARWGDDGTILYSQGARGVWRVSAEGGKPEHIIKVSGGELAQSPQLLPGGRAVLLTIGPGPADWDQAQIIVHRLDTGVRQVVITGGTDARYLPTGHLVYAQRGTLMAVRFDARSYRVTGRAVPVQDGLNPPGVTGAVQFSVADNGTLVYVPGTVYGLGTGSGFPLRTLAWVDRDGVESLIPAPRRAYSYPRLSPDGARIALDVAEENRDIWVWDLARTTLMRLTSDPSIDQLPAWTPDGRYVLFGSARANGVSNLYRQLADGTHDAERITESRDDHFPTAVTPDGRQAILAAGGQGDLMVVGLDGPRQIERLTRTPFSERNGAISPDGRWLAYSADDTGQHEIYVRPFPNTDASRWQVSTGGGLQPLWSRTGRELFFRTPTGTLMSVPVDPGAEWSIRPAKLLLEARAYWLGAMTLARTYDVSLDGSRFLFIKPDSLEQGGASRMIVVENWFEELKRLTAP